MESISLSLLSLSLSLQLCFDRTTFATLFSLTNSLLLIQSSFLDIELFFCLTLVSPPLIMNVTQHTSTEQAGGIFRFWERMEWNRMRRKMFVSHSWFNTRFHFLLSLSLAFPFLSLKFSSSFAQIFFFFRSNFLLLSFEIWTHLVSYFQLFKREKDEGVKNLFIHWLPLFDTLLTDTLSFCSLSHSSLSHTLFSHLMINVYSGHTKSRDLSLKRGKILSSICFQSNICICIYVCIYVYT